MGRERERERQAEREGQDVEQSLIYGLIFPGVRSQLILRFNCFVTRRPPPPSSPPKGSFDLIKRIRRMSPRGPSRTSHYAAEAEEGGKKPPSSDFSFTYDSSRETFCRCRPRDFASLFVSSARIGRLDKRNP